KPTTSDRATAEIAMPRSKRAATMTRLRISRPSASVPKGCRAVGGASLIAAEVVSGSNGAMEGPKSAQSASSARMMAAASVSRFSPKAYPVLRASVTRLMASALEPDAWIDQGREDVDRKIQQHVKQ